MLLGPEAGVGEMVLLSGGSEEVWVLVVGLERRFLELAMVVARDHLDLVETAIALAEPHIGRERGLEVGQRDAPGIQGETGAVDL